MCDSNVWCWIKLSNLDQFAFDAGICASIRLGLVTQCTRQLRVESSVTAGKIFSLPMFISDCVAMVVSKEHRCDTKERDSI